MFILHTIVYSKCMKNYACIMVLNLHKNHEYNTWSNEILFITPY